MLSNAALNLTIAKQKAEISHLTDGNQQLQSEVKRLAAQVKWFQNQLFGQKSERRVVEPLAGQLFLGEQFKPEIGETETETKVVKEHKRKKSKARSVDGDAFETVLLFRCCYGQRLLRSKNSRLLIPMLKA